VCCFYIGSVWVSMVVIFFLVGLLVDVGGVCRDDRYHFIYEDFDGLGMRVLI